MSTPDLTPTQRKLFAAIQREKAKPQPNLPKLKKLTRRLIYLDTAHPILPARSNLPTLGT